MFINLNNLNNAIRNRHKPVEYDVSPYKKILDEINEIKLEKADDAELKEMSRKLKQRACSGEALDSLIVETYALVREVSRRVLGMYHFDVQVIAAIAMHRGKLVEMQTGEGKTLAAVMPVCLNALTGKGVHVLTFNDYLAQRDAEWMGPVYEFLGLSVGFIKEGMDTIQRQNAYFKDITYLTVKEAGFDYLRDFLCNEKEKLVHRPFNYAVVDEADSILIDEARIPLVIAANMAHEGVNPIQIDRLVRCLRTDEDYELEQYGNNIYLTDTGLARAEGMLGCGNLYLPQNLTLLTMLNCALHAHLLLKKDKDYIVRDGKIEIVDEFTGRTADKRHWPDNIHAAVEAKEGLIHENKGMIMGSITIQHFLELYPKITGMTGTAYTSAEEIKEFYGMDVFAVPTNKPCIRKDYHDLIFTHKEAKQKALLAEIKRIHETGQPVLIGTASVEESEALSGFLHNSGITCQVLNAKNDEMEAGIIASAGRLGTVTVSTNMAGRGVDIKPGGENEEEREKVNSLGGLYVIGTNRHESRRIDNQLKGRTGRQGEPGESRLFVSLEDDIVKKYDITKLIPERSLPKRQDGPIEDPAVHKAAQRGQRIVEGYNSDIRRQLWRYTCIIEQQRRIIHNKRQRILLDQDQLKLLATRAPERYSLLLGQLGEGVLRKVEKQLTLYFINKCWADYLDYVSYIREGIHLVVLGKKTPLDEFHRLVIEAFEKLKDTIEQDIISAFNSVEVNENGIDMEKEGLKSPSSTWTYLVNESASQFSSLPRLIKAASTAINGPLFSVSSFCRRVFKGNTGHK